MRVLLTVSSQEIYWKSRGTFQKIRYTVIVLRLVKKKRFFFFIIIANGIDTAAGRYPIRLKYDSRAAPCAALSEKSAVLQARADAARAAPVVGARSDLTRFTDRFNSIQFNATEERKIISEGTRHRQFAVGS